MALVGPAGFMGHFNAVKERYGKRGYTVAIVSTAMLMVIWAMLTDGSEFIGKSTNRIKEEEACKEG